jgi:hypothetical protein
MFDAASSSYAYRTNPTATSITTATVSFWVKRSAITGTEQIVVSGRYNDNNQGRIGFTATDKMQVAIKDGGNTRSFVSDATFRDCSGWYHFVIAVDGTQVVGNDRINVYCNGVGPLSGTYNTVLNMQFEGFMGSTNVASIGRRQRNAEMYFNGYIAEIVGVDGQQLTATSFGQFKKGIWIPKAYTGSYGLAGCHVKFENSSDLGNDSANVLDYTLSNIGTDHQVLDSPTNNYATLDWNNGFHSSTYPLHEGGLEHHNTASTWLHSQGTFVMKTGKWYWEYTNGSDIQHNCFGICAQGERSGDNVLTSGTTQFVGYAEGWGVLSNSGVWVKWNNNVGTAISPNTLAVNDIIQIAFDADANKLWFGKNGTWVNSGNPATGANASYSNMNAQKQDLVACQVTHSNATNKVNFGQRAFAYTPPTGFNACCSANLEEPSILQPEKGVDVLLWTGDATTTRDITGLNFQPDFIWIKNRSSSNYGHLVYDSIRGVGNTKEIRTDANLAEGGAPCETNGYVSAILSTGFTIAKGTTDAAYVNYSGSNYVAWCLKKGVQFGFDIQGYTGNGTAGKTVSHDLDAVPELVIVKNRSAARNWRVYHHHALDKTTPYTDSGILDTTTIWADLWADSNLYWNDTAPTSTVVTLGSNPDVNQNTSDHIMYLWRSIEGFSKVFSFEGNGNANGPYVYCGFRPRWILWKNADAATNWTLYDTARDVYNGANTKYIAGNEASAETATGVFLDYFSNGFKLKLGLGNNNTFVGIAFAETPQKYSNAR